MDTAQPAVFVKPEGLFRVQVRPSLSRYLRKVWMARTFVFEEARSRAFSTGRGSFLGRAWLILDPLLQVSIYAVVFGLILNVSRGMDNFVGFLVLGVTFFGYFSRGINSASGMVQRTRPLIATFNLPMMCVPLSATLRQAMDGLIPLVVAVSLALGFQPEHKINGQLVLIFPLYFLAHVFVLGAQLWVARATAFLPDLKQVVNVAMRGLFFVSGVFFTLERFETHPLLKSIVSANPIYQFLEIARQCVIYGGSFPVERWLYVLTWSAALLISGILFAWRAEGRYAFVR